MYTKFVNRHNSIVVVQKLPPAGLEPTTTKSRALRSADWARQGMRYVVGNFHINKKCKLVICITNADVKKQSYILYIIHMVIYSMEKWNYEI